MNMRKKIKKNTKRRRIEKHTKKTLISPKLKTSKLKIISASNLEKLQLKTHQQYIIKV